MNKVYGWCFIFLSALSILGAVIVQSAFAQDASAWYQPGKHEGVTLNVVLNASHANAPYDEIYGQLKTQFEELTGATITFVPISENEMYTKVRLALLAGQCTYDAMETGAGGAKDYGLSGFLAPLPTPPDVADMFEGDVNQYSVDGELYGMPMFADTNILFWRTDLFEEAGLDPNQPPTTYQEFRDYAIKLTKDANGKSPGDEGFDPNNVVVWGAAFKGSQKLASTWEWYNYLYAFDGEVFDKDYNVIVDQQPAIDSLQWVVDNFRKYNIYPPDTINFDYSEFHTLFTEGKVAMAINWPYMWGLVQDPEQSKVVDKVAIGRKPEGVRHGGNIGGWSFNVFKDCPNQAAAIDLAKWMASPEAGQLYAGVSLVPVRKSILEAKAAEEGQPWQAIAENLQDGQMVSALATGESWMPIENALQVAIQKSLIGDMEPADALKEAAVEIRQILDDNGFYTDILGR
jgi:multiple sugar transport system substrate-binding protein